LLPFHDQAFYNEIIGNFVKTNLISSWFNLWFRVTPFLSFFYKQIFKDTSSSMKGFFVTLEKKQLFLLGIGGGVSDLYL